MNTAKTLDNLKVNGQDFEWYPTTKKILQVIKQDLKKKYTAKLFNNLKILDVGAGDGRVLKKLSEHLLRVGWENGSCRLFAFEKAKTFIPLLQKQEVTVLGCDFFLCDLFDKKMDIIFSNPPYSQWADWTRKLLAEAETESIYLVLPVRWKENKEIQNVIKERNFESAILGTFDFLNAERQARAKVDVVCFRCTMRREAFDYLFDSSFKFKNLRSDKYAWKKELNSFESKKKSNPGEIVESGNLVEALVRCYDTDKQKIINSYKLLCKVDLSILSDVDIDISLSSIKNSLWEKLITLKNSYWKSLLDNLPVIIDRLTSEKREMLYSYLTDLNIDFNRDNIYCVVLEIIKKANRFIDDQIKKVFERLTCNGCIYAYKSNERFISGKWRYAKPEGLKKYCLDYRIVYEGYSCFNGYEFEKTNGLNKWPAQLIGDICTVGKCLGFSVVNRVEDYQWSPGKKNSFYMLDDGDKTVFMTVKCYKNGNIHFQFNKKFMQTLNIVAGRLFGWLNSAEDAAEEMKDVNIKTAAAVFSHNFHVLPSKVKMLSM